MTVLALLCLAAFSGYLGTYALARRHLLSHAFPVPAEKEPDVGRVSVVIPAYDEQSGIADAIRGALAGSRLGAEALEVLVIDDGSTDRTLEIAEAVAEELGDPRLRILRSARRPDGQRWVGKSWPCWQAAREASGETLVFLDADVRVLPGGLDGLLTAARDSGAAMITAIPALECGSFAERAVQPTIHAMIATATWLWPAADDSTSLDIALGHIMVFQRAAYERVGGFAAVRHGVGQDIQFAKQFRAHGLSRDALLAQRVAAVRPYRSFRATWEGYTKGSTSVGLNHRAFLTVALAAYIVLMLSLPWLLGVGFVAAGWLGSTGPASSLGAAAVLLTLVLQMLFVRLSRTIMLNDLPPPWYSLATGGVLWPLLMVGDVVKARRPRGATWKGRAVGSASSSRGAPAPGSP